MIPDRLNDVLVRRRWCPQEYLYVMVCKPLFCKLQCVFQIAVLLENNSVGLDILILKRAEEWFREDFNILLGIHVSINVVKLSCPMPWDATPDHNAPSAMLHLLNHITQQEFLSNPPSAVLLAIWSKNIVSGLVCIPHLPPKKFTL